MASFLLVHGGGGGAYYWYKVVDRLSRSGHRVKALDLAASGSDTRTHADVETFDDYNQPLLDYLAAQPAGEKVVLVSHSLGGSSAAYATELFPDKIALAVYIAAPMCSRDVGELKKNYRSVMNYALYGKGEDHPPTAVQVPNRRPDHAHQLCSSEDFTLSMMLDRPVPLAALFPEFTNTADKYGKVPRVYVKTLQDRVLEPEVQDRFIAEHPFENLKAVLSVDTDHCAALSAPDKVHELLIYSHKTFT